MIDLEWCEQQADRIIERDSRCRQCGHVTTTYGRRPWATRCGFCGSEDVKPLGGLIREPDRAEPFLIGEE